MGDVTLVTPGIGDRRGKRDHFPGHSPESRSASVSAAPYLPESQSACGILPAAHCLVGFFLMPFVPVGRRRQRRTRRGMLFLELWVAR